MEDSGRRQPLTPELWRRVGAVIDRLSDTDVDRQPDAIDEACRAEGVSRDLAEPFLAATRHSDDLPERVEPALLLEALTAPAGAASTSAASLEPGIRIGAYEIVALIGAGGMGEVYRARDTRLDRSVALKVLRAELADRADAQQRFEREARALSSLNHPHICTLHDIGRDDRAPAGFLVMELVEGETLAACLQRGPIPATEALEYAVQIADTLAVAHRHGIVHRDLKPANVMLTAHGVKLLDFGLAALRPSTGSVRSFDEGLTAEGAILGTLPYMAPEQIQGQPTDERTDIFALGAILFEMLTRARAFDGDNPAGVIAAVLERDRPRIPAQRADLPPATNRVIERCLAKSPDARWPTAADLASELRWLRDMPAQSVHTPAVRRAHRSARMVLLLVSLTAAFAIALGAYWLMPRGDRSSAVYRFTLPPPPGTIYTGLFALSPDGHRLVFTATDGAGVSTLWLRPLDAVTAQPINETRGASYPFWSPDGRSIGFFADRMLKIAELATGSVRVVCEAGRGGGGTWNADGIIVFAPDSGVPGPSGLMRVPAAGGDPKPLTKLPDGLAGLHTWPQFLPDGRHYLYTRIEFADAATATAASMAVYAGSLDERETTQVVAERRATYANGHLFYVHDGRLLARPFDVTRLAVSGEPVQIAENVEQTAPGRAAYDVSANGLLAYRTGTPRANNLSQMTWFDRAGRQIARLGEPGRYASAVLSPDGRYVLTAGGGKVQRVDVTNGTTTPLPEDGIAGPVWSPDGRTMAFTGGSRDAGPTSVGVRAVDGSGPSRTILPRGHQVYPNDWSTNGQFIVGSVIRTDTGYDLFVTRIGSSTATYPVASRFDETDPDLSPDMRWIAYAATDESRRWDVYVRSFGTTGGVWRVSRAGGRHPRWSRDGRELFYVAPDGTLMHASISEGPGFQATDIRELFQHNALSLDFNTPLAYSPYDVTSDGQRFLLRVAAESRVAEPIILLLNWPKLLQH
jgi:serine/threonine protein kinase/Tol biopolymer transport system component